MRLLPALISALGREGRLCSEAIHRCLDLYESGAPRVVVLLSGPRSNDQYADEGSRKYSWLSIDVTDESVKAPNLCELQVPACVSASKFLGCFTENITSKSSPNIFGNSFAATWWFAVNPSPPPKKKGSSQKQDGVPHQVGQA